MVFVAVVSNALFLPVFILGYDCFNDETCLLRLKSSGFLVIMQSHRITFLQVSERASPPGTRELQILNTRFAPTVRIVKMST